MTDLSAQPSAAKPTVIPEAVSDLEAVLGTPQGRRTLLRILERCNVYGDAFNPDHSYEARRLGEMNIGRWLIDQLGEISPTEYPRLLIHAANVRGGLKETVHVVDQE